MSNALLAGGGRVMLQTAQVVMCGKDGVQCQAHILMDSTSHRTFKTEQMAKQLNLLSQRVESLSLLTFGTKKPQHLDTYVVNFNIIVKDGSSLPYVPVCFNRLLVLFGKVICIKLMLSFFK